MDIKEFNNKIVPIKEAFAAFSRSDQERVAYCHQGRNEKARSQCH